MLIGCIDSVCVCYCYLQLIDDRAVCEVEEIEGALVVATKETSTAHTVLCV